MDLEEIEIATLKYLDQTKSPLVSVDVLYAHLKDRGLPDQYTPRDLVDFLSGHGQVKLMAPPVELEAGVSPTEAGAPSGLFAMLESRRPTETQLATMMIEQLDVLEEALRIARQHAADTEDDARRAQIEEALRRTGSLRERLAPHSGAADAGDAEDTTPPDNVIRFPGLN